MIVTPAFAIPGGPELLIIGVIVVLLFGADKIPKLARSVGQASGELKKGKQEAEDELEEIREDIEQTAEIEDEADFSAD